MTPRDFTMWLEGYLKDRKNPSFKSIEEKLKQVVQETQSNYQPYFHPYTITTDGIDVGYPYPNIKIT